MVGVQARAASVMLIPGTGSFGSFCCCSDRLWWESFADITLVSSSTEGRNGLAASPLAVACRRVSGELTVNDLW